MRSYKNSFLLFQSYLVCTLLCLTGCTTLSPTSTQEFNNKNSSTVIKRIPIHQSWGAQGSLAIRTPEKGWSASFDWRQQYQYYRLSIFGPLGANSILLTGNNTYAVLESNGTIDKAANVEVLLKKRLGWYIPVNNLHYWIQGSPAKGAPYKILRNATGEAAMINQQGWQIEYQEYDDFGFPTLMELHYGKLLIRIAIRQWMF